MRILSLGAGVQSSTIALMAEHGEIDRPDCAIFADTGWEPKKVYEWLDFIESKVTYKIIRVSKGNLREDLIENINNGSRFASVPFFTAGGGMGRRQCTNEYKLRPIQQQARALLGYEKGQRIPQNSAEMLIGISTDEIVRMKPSRVKWIQNRWPLLEKKMSRNDCYVWMNKNGYPIPPKSSCIGCPYHSNSHWKDMQKNDADSFDQAIEIDDLLRKNGARKSMNNQEFMHRSLKPMREIKFYDTREQELDLFQEECEGICGV